ncbi:hypothetical protein BO94DRAFT_520444 [Aspergillus sclerotioniger CBS 115572]|uniref:Restriction endonuclease domain-containing protein n=1 Tax=Aspergillus sclerotioniger CBS 115572 TaxID=1450535 RepID=A0A317W6U3_9EURO|nr:hypothetical protein BO94DRAFT_520444 [Aspergillus sclerotioniger CBS 115572]PWY81675.1 hypothetical protein BO94DRAFT_520444 [Aspergillus sclerotioniger CBS 115572]
MSHKRSPALSNHPPWTTNKLFSQAKHGILSPDQPFPLQYTAIEEKIGHTVACNLSEDKDIKPRSIRITYNPIIKTLHIKKPVWGHDIFSSWAEHERIRACISGFFTPDETDGFWLYKSPLVNKFPPPFQSTIKEPEWCIAPFGEFIPTIVCEIGCSESSLTEDKDLWMTAGGSHVNVVILLKWSALDEDCVSGYFEIWRRGGVVPERIVSLL